MSLFVKICGLRRAADVQAAVAAGADALGFVFAPSPRRVTPQEAAALARDVPPTVLRVAVMRHPAPAEWREVESVFRPDVLQTDAQDFARLEVPPGIERWPVLRDDEKVAESPPGRFVYEAADSGRGARADWDTAAALARRGRLILAGGLDSGNVAEAVRRVAPFGVDVSSGVESSPGVKDAERIRAFVAAARAAGG
jgi:phosphoribosylanthranilate isomerase